MTLSDKIDIADEFIQSIRVVPVCELKESIKELKKTMDTRFDTIIIDKIFGEELTK